MSQAEHPLATHGQEGDAKKGLPDGPPNGWVILAAWGPCGYAPWAPGTAGTLGAIPLFWALCHLSLPIYLLTAAALTALAIYAAQAAGKYWKEADAPQIVIDEVVGYLITMTAVPWSWPSVLIGFALFRLFDVLKPWPASAFDRVKSGFGVVMDDVAAGVYAWGSLAAIRFLVTLWLGCEGARWWCGGFGS